MRLALTVVSPIARHWADVVVDADPATPVGELAAELSTARPRRLTGSRRPRAPETPRSCSSPASRAPGSLAIAGPVAGHGPQARAVPLYVDFQPVAPQLTLAQSADPGRGGDQPRLARGLPAARSRPAWSRSR